MFFQSVISTVNIYGVSIFVQTFFLCHETQNTFSTFTDNASERRISLIDVYKNNSKHQKCSKKWTNDNSWSILLEIKNFRTSEMSCKTRWTHWLIMTI
jgi:hypothetical protein